MEEISYFVIKGPKEVYYATGKTNLQENDDIRTLLDLTTAIQNKNNYEVTFGEGTTFQIIGANSFQGIKFNVMSINNYNIKDKYYTKPMKDDEIAERALLIKNGLIDNIIYSLRKLKDIYDSGFINMIIFRDMCESGLYEYANIIKSFSISKHGCLRLLENGVINRKDGVVALDYSEDEKIHSYKGIKYSLSYRNSTIPRNLECLNNGVHGFLHMHYFDTKEDLANYLFLRVYKVWRTYLHENYGSGVVVGTPALCYKNIFEMVSVLKTKVMIGQINGLMLQGPPEWFKSPFNFTRKEFKSKCVFGFNQNNYVKYLELMTCPLIPMYTILPEGYNSPHKIVKVRSLRYVDVIHGGESAIGGRVSAMPVGKDPVLTEIVPTLDQRLTFTIDRPYNNEKGFEGYGGIYSLKSIEPAVEDMNEFKGGELVSLVISKKGHIYRNQYTERFYIPQASRIKFTSSIYELIPILYKILLCSYFYGIESLEIDGIRFGLKQKLNLKRPNRSFYKLAYCLSVALSYKCTKVVDVETFEKEYDNPPHFKRICDDSLLVMKENAIYDLLTTQYDILFNGSKDEPLGAMINNENALAWRATMQGLESKVGTVTSVQQSPNVAQKSIVISDMNQFATGVINNEYVANLVECTVSQLKECLQCTDALIFKLNYCIPSVVEAVMEEFKKDTDFPIKDLVMIKPPESALSGECYLYYGYGENTNVIGTRLCIGKEIDFANAISFMNIYYPTSDYRNLNVYYDPAQSQSFDSNNSLYCATVVKQTVFKDILSLMQSKCFNTNCYNEGDNMTMVGTRSISRERLFEFIRPSEIIIFDVPHISVFPSSFKMRTISAASLYALACILAFKKHWKRIEPQYYHEEKFIIAVGGRNFHEMLFYKTKSFVVVDPVLIPFENEVKKDKEFIMLSKKFEDTVNADYGNIDPYDDGVVMMNFVIQNSINQIELMETLLEHAFYLFPNARVYLNIYLNRSIELYDSSGCVIERNTIIRDVTPDPEEPSDGEEEEDENDDTVTDLLPRRLNKTADDPPEKEVIAMGTLKGIFDSVITPLPAILRNHEVYKFERIIVTVNDVVEASLSECGMPSKGISHLMSLNAFAPCYYVQKQ